MAKPMNDDRSDLGESRSVESDSKVLTDRQSPDLRTQFGIRYFEASVSLVKAVAWPILVLFLFFVLRGPVFAILEQLPGKISQSTKFSVGSLSFEIQQTAAAAGNPELGHLISGLSPTAIEKLLNTARSRQQLVGEGMGANVYTFPDQKEMDAIIELENKGLLKFEVPRSEFDSFVQSLHLKEESQQLGERTDYVAPSPLDQAQQQRLRQQVYYLTELGERTFDLIVTTVVQQLQTPSINAVSEDEKKPKSKKK